MKTLKFGILGSGYIAAKMAEAVKCIENRNMGVEAYAIASRELTKAQKFAREHGFQKAYGSYEELASDPDIDLIYIATPHSAHFEHAKLCIEAGKNVLVEKAFCANTKQATQIIAMAHDKGVFVCEAMWTRFLPAVQMVNDWICAGKIGEVENVEADFSQPISHVERLQNPALAGGALLDLGIYSLTFADLFLGDANCAGGNSASGNAAGSNNAGSNAAGSNAADLGTTFAPDEKNNSAPDGESRFAPDNKTATPTTNPIVKIENKCVKFRTGVDATDWIDITYENGKTAHLKTSMVDDWHNEGKIYGTQGFIRVVNLNDMEKIELHDATGAIVEEVNPPRLENCYEYEVLACKKAIEAPETFRQERENRSLSGSSRETIWETREMPHAKTIEMMEIMDSLRANWGASYPFEISPGETWDRSGNKSILQIYDIETGKTQVLQKFDQVIEAPNWSSDGTFLTYNAGGRIYKLDLVYGAAGNPNMAGNPNVASITAGAITQVPSHYVDNCNNDHVLSPDGQGLYVSHHTKEDGLSRIYKIFFDGSMPELVTPLGPSYLHGITPDGKTLAYCAERNGEYDIYTIPAIGGNETRLTTAKGLNDGPEYDANGEYIWFNSVRTGRMQAWRMKADGTEQTPVTSDLHWNTWFPHISPDNERAVMICYHETDVRPGEHVPNKDVEIRLIERHPGTDNWSAPRTLLKFFGGQGSINVNSWAPDSRHFAFVTYIKNT